MKTRVLDYFSPYVHSQAGLNKEAMRSVLPIITISRETGAGAVSIAQLVAERLEARNQISSCPWLAFDRNLAEQVLADHSLDARLHRYLPEDAAPVVHDAMEELFGFHPPSSTLVQHTAETILRLANRGHVVLVGRGSNIITAKIRSALHVRLVAPLERRIAHAEDYYHLSSKEAADFVRETDLARRRYLRHYFNADIEDPRAYHLVINTALMPFDRVAETIATVSLSMPAELVQQL